MARISQQTLDLSDVLKQVNQLTLKFDGIENTFNKLNQSINKMGGGFDKVNRSLQNSNKQTYKLLNTFSKIQGLVRFIAMSPFGKGLALGVGAVGSVIGMAKDSIQGTLSDLALARSAQSSLYNVRAFDRASTIGGMDNLISKQDIANFKEKLNDVNYMGGSAHLGALLGLSREQMSNMDSADLMVKSLQSIDNFIQKNGGYNSLSGNALTQATGLLELLGIDMQTMRAGNWGQFAKDYQKQKNQGINANTFSKTERAFLQLGYAWKDFKDMLLRNVMPTLYAFSNKLQEVIKKAVDYFLNNGIFDKIGNALGNFFDTLLNYDYGALFSKVSEWIKNISYVGEAFLILGRGMKFIVELFTVTLPNALKNFLSFIYGALSKIPFADKDNSYKYLSSFHKFDAQGYADKKKEAYLNYAINNAIGKTEAERNESLAKLFAEIIKNADLRIKIETEAGLRANVIQDTTGATIARNR